MYMKVCLNDVNECLTIGTHYHIHYCDNYNKLNYICFLTLL